MVVNSAMAIILVFFVPIDHYDQYIDLLMCV